MLDLPDQLDPQIAAMLIEAWGHAGTTTADLPLDAARAGYALRYVARGLPAPSAGVAVTDLAIPAPWGPLAARLYRPQGSDRPALALYFHGGGFVFGDLDAYDPQCRNLALASGVAILCVDYRRAPEHPFPAAVADAQAATCWALDTAAALGVDPGRIGLCGDSAGGALSLVTALALPGRLRAVLALYPVTDMRELGLYDSARRFGKGFFLDLRLMQRFTDLYLPDPALALDPRVSVLLAEGLHRLPPNLIVTAGADPLRDQGEAFARRAAAAGAPVAIRCEAAMIHNFMGHGAVSAGAAAAFGRVAADLRRLLA